MVREVKGESEAASGRKGPTGGCMLRWGGLEEKCEQTQDNTSTPMAQEQVSSSCRWLWGGGTCLGTVETWIILLNHPPHPPAPFSKLNQVYLQILRINLTSSTDSFQSLPQTPCTCLLAKCLKFFQYRPKLFIPLLEAKNLHSIANNQQKQNIS